MADLTWLMNKRCHFHIDRGDFKGFNTIFADIPRGEAQIEGFIEFFSLRQIPSVSEKS